LIQIKKVEHRVNFLEKLENKLTSQTEAQIQQVGLSFSSEEKFTKFIDEKIKSALKIKFTQPNHLYKIEKIITNQINQLPDKPTVIQDLLENSGEELYKMRLRRSYLKRLFCEEIKGRIKKHMGYTIKRNYSFFDVQKNPPVFDAEENKPQEPDDCYSFNDIQNILR
jgi:hypothetical protein